MKQKGFLFLFGIVFCCSGCVQTVQEPADLGLLGLKLGDIEPTYHAELPKKIDFRIFTFELPLAEYSKVKDVFSEVADKPLHFRDQRGFGANGFAVRFGQNDTWNEIAEKLRDNSAKKTETKMLVVYDDKGDDVAIRNFGSETTVLYTKADGSVAEAAVGPGKLVWRIKAKPIATMRGTSEVAMVAVFKRNVNPLIRRMVGVREGDELVFDSIGFNLKMSEGDFVFLGPREEKQDRLSLAELFFMGRGEFILPTMKVEGQERGILQKGPYTLYKDVPLVRLQLIVCVEVQN